VIQTRATLNVPARAWTDDGAVSVEFDAADWLRTASVGALRALDACGWRGDYGSDQVALDLSDTNAEIADLFAYLEQINRCPARETVGFEVSVDEEAALEWLETNRSIRRLLTD
jgi:hypothetical protein